jgi:hypothetical protein
MPSPSVGRVVHYAWHQSEPDCRDAIITKVKEAPNVAHSGIVDLFVLSDSNPFFRHDVPFVLAERRIAGTWHWPERVD